MPGRTKRMDPPEGYAYCTYHKEVHPISDFPSNSRTRSGVGSWCNKARNERNSKFNEKLGTDYNKYRRGQRRAYVIWKYGGKCRICGEADPLVLCLDHINGDGEDRGRGEKSIKDAIDNDFPGDLQLLCHNCNSKKERERQGNVALFDRWYGKWIEAFERGDIAFEGGVKKTSHTSFGEILVQDVP